MTPDEREADQHRLLSLVEQLQRAGHSQREIESALREASADEASPRRPKPGTRRLLTRFMVSRLWA